MNDAFLGEIRPFAISYAPTGWALCDGRIYPLTWNTALFTLISNRYGGDGRATFGLPNIQGTVLVGSGPMPGGATYEVGRQGGNSGIPLRAEQMPVHTHTVNGLVTIDPNDPDAAPKKGVRTPSPTIFLSNVFEVPPYTTKRQGNFYATTPPDDQLNPRKVGSIGNGRSHNNMQPYLVINYCICTNGYFPSRP
jgi:microcystin-dependent protein